MPRGDVRHGASMPAGCVDGGGRELSGDGGVRCPWVERCGDDGWAASARSRTPPAASRHHGAGRDHGRATGARSTARTAARAYP